MTTSIPMDAAVEAIVTGVRTGLREVADPAKAPDMQAYMKTSEPFLGVKLPQVRTVVRAHPPADLDTLIAASGRLWREASAREERYAATMLLRAEPGAGRLELLPLATEMITTVPGGTTSDAVAHTTCELLLAHRNVMTPRLREWAVADDLWLRRSAIIGQLDARHATDLDLLTYAIEVNVADREFFVRKAIGWALRQYVRTDAGWVRAFLASHPDLSPLSRREAAKHL